LISFPFEFPLSASKRLVVVFGRLVVTLGSSTFFGSTSIGFSATGVDGEGIGTEGVAF
jgi:hypothetical protein